MGKDLDREVETFVDGAFHEKTAIGVVAVSGLRDDGIASAPVEAPGSDLLVSPERELVPGVTHAQATGIAAGGKLEHGEGADLRTIFGLFEPGNFSAEFHVGEADGGGTSAAGSVDGIVVGIDGAKRDDEMELQPGQRAPVELESGTERIDFSGCTVGRAEDVELIMAVIDRNGVVGLEGRPRLSPQLGRSQHEEQKQR